MKANYTQQTALKKVLKIGEVKEVSPNIFIVKNGTVGNGTLGAISYLNKHSDYIVSVIDEKSFNKSKGKQFRKVA